MSAEKIIEQIKKDTEKKINELKKETDKEKQEIIKNAKNQGKQEAKIIKEEGKKKAENHKKILISQANQETNRKKMKVKEEMIDECFKKVKEKLANLKGKEYQKITTELIEKSMKKIPGEKIVYISKETDKKIAEKLNIKVAGKIESIGGMIISSKDGKITIDETFEGIIKREKSEMRNKVGKILFS